MSRNALKMSIEEKVSYSTVRRWIRKGYFGEVKKDKQGYYSLPDELPLPYVTNGKIERDTSLMKALLDASDLGRSVHKNMFPKISMDRYSRILASAVTAHLVETRSPFPGVTQLVSTPEGRAILNADSKTQDKIFEKIAAGAKVAIVLAEFGIQYGPQLLDFLSSLSIA